MQLQMQYSFGLQSSLSQPALFEMEERKKVTHKSCHDLTSRLDSDDFTEYSRLPSDEDATIRDADTSLQEPTELFDSQPLDIRKKIVSKGPPVLFILNKKSSSFNNLQSVMPFVEVSEPLSAREKGTRRKLSLESDFPKKWKFSFIGVSRIKNLLVKTFKTIPFASSEELNKAMNELKQRSIHANRLAISAPQHINCEKLYEKEYSIAWRIEEKIGCSPILLKNIYVRMEIARNALKTSKLNNKVITKLVLDVLKKLLSVREQDEGRQLETFLSVFMQNTKIGEIRKIIFITIAGKQKEEAQRIINTLHAWNKYSALSALEELHAVNWEDVVKAQICNQFYAWSDADSGNKIREIPIGEVVKGYVNPACKIPVIKDVTINGCSISLDELHGTIEDCQTELFLRIIMKLYEEGFSTKGFGEIEEQIQALVKWVDPVKAEADLSEFVKEEISFDVEKVWIELPYEDLLRMGTINALLIFRTTLSEILPGLFESESPLKAQLDKGIRLHLTIGDDYETDHKGMIYKKHLATQLISLTIYPKVFSDPTRYILDQNKPLGSFNIEWTVIHKEVLNSVDTSSTKGKEKSSKNDTSIPQFSIYKHPDDLSEGYFKIINFAFTEFATQEYKRKILYEFFKIKNMCIHPADLDGESTFFEEDL